MTAEVAAKKRVPLEILHSGAREQSRRLRWIPPTETFSLHGIPTRGGFFLQPSHGFRFSFAVDPTLPIGDAERAEPINLRPHQHLSYDGLTLNQRARYLKGLARSSGNQVEDQYFCLQLACLEWRFLSRAEGDDAVEAACDLFIPERIPTCRRALTFVSWALHSTNSRDQLALMEDLYNARDLLCLSPSLLEQGLMHLVAARKTVGPELALAVGRFRDHQHQEWEDRQFQKKFLDEFTAAFPSGLTLPVSTGTVKVDYLPACWELTRQEYLRQPVWSTRVATYLWHSEPLYDAIVEIRRAVLAQPRLDKEKLKRLKGETGEIQAELRAARERGFPSGGPVQSCCQPDPHVVQASVRFLIQRGEWSAADFGALAGKLGLMPDALQRAINRWSMSISAGALLEGNDPIRVNNKSIEVVKRNL